MFTFNPLRTQSGTRGVASRFAGDARVDETDKIKFDAFCTSVGLNTSTAINLFVKAVLRERRIPFEIKQEDPFFSPENQAYVLKSVQELRSGKGTAHDLIETNE